MMNDKLRDEVGHVDTNRPLPGNKTPKRMVDKITIQPIYTETEVVPSMSDGKRRRISQRNAAQSQSRSEYLMRSMDALR